MGTYARALWRCQLIWYWRCAPVEDSLVLIDDDKIPMLVLAKSVPEG